MVLEFTVTWCPPGQANALKFSYHAKAAKDYAVSLKTDADKKEEATEACEISCMPTFQFFKNGGKVHENLGTDYYRLKAAFE